MPLFSRKKKLPTPAESIEQLKQTLELLEKREVFLQKKIDQQVVEAKKYVAGKNKKAALMCLKRKKCYESQIDRISGSRLTIESQVMTLESASVDLGVLRAMQSGANALRTMTGGLDLDSVSDTMEDIRDQMEIANEISNALIAPIDLDEDELLAELEELEDEVQDPLLQSLPTPVRTIPYPLAPQRAPASEDAELAALEASMA